MSTLARFRKPGGFRELVILIERCSPDKQKSLFHKIAAEDPGWAHLLKTKVLTFRRILDWPPETLMEITPNLSDHTLVVLYKVAESYSKKNQLLLHEKLLDSLPYFKKSEILDQATVVDITISDQNAALLRLLHTVRELELRGKISFKNFDPLLLIDLKLVS